MNEYQWKTVSVIGFDELMQALDRAERKGYMPDAISAEWEAFNWGSEQPAQQQDADHDFKNFHRSLCERFNYAHDEKDWKRDLVSLEEWIAKKVQPEQEPVAIVSGYYGGQCVILPIDPARIFNSNTALYTKDQL